MSRAPALLAGALLLLLAAAGRCEQPCAVDEETPRPVQRAEGVGLSCGISRFGSSQERFPAVSQLLEASGGDPSAIPRGPMSESFVENPAARLMDGAAERGSAPPSAANRAAPEATRDSTPAPVDARQSPATSESAASRTSVAAPRRDSPAAPAGSPDSTNPTGPGASLPDPWEIGYNQAARGNLLGAVLALRSRRDAYLASPMKIQFLENYGTLLSWVGNYRGAIHAFDEEAQARGLMPARLPDSEIRLTGLRAIPAVEMVRDAGRIRQVLFINEAHHVPEHRAFTETVLKELYADGFRYFAAETLEDHDEGLGARGYPTDATGFYTHEPVYGSLVRTALSLGYKVVPYEFLPDCNPSQTDPDACQNLRERGQAENLKARIFDKDPHAKVLVHAGYGHIQRKVFGGWHPMATYFQDLTGIAPFSIDQVAMTEHSSPEFEDAYYRKITEKFKFSQPLALQKSDGSPWVEHPEFGYDAQVIHPRGRERQGRPTWLLMDGARKLVRVPKDACATARPCLIQARYAREPDDAVPVDQVMVDRDQIPPSLALPPGEFRVRVLDSAGTAASSFTLRVK